MPRSRTQYFGPQTILQVWDGVAKTGFIENSGGFATITDVSHGDVSRKLGHGDVGSAMILRRKRRAYGTGRCFAGTGIGSSVAIRPTSTPSAPSEPHNSDLWGQGGTAIARCAPTNPSWAGADALAQYVGRDAIPKALGSSVWRDTTRYFRSLGKEYLNLAFGWAPFVADITNVCKAVVSSHEYMQNLREGSDHVTRAGYGFPSTTQAFSPGGGQLWSVDKTLLIAWHGGPQVSSGESGSDVWFKGAFRYHIPVPSGSHEKSARFAQYASHVLGLRLTPEVLWDAAPWTWLADWAVNIGDVEHNIGAFANDGLTLQYGYIMCHRWRRSLWSTLGGSNCTGANTLDLQEWKVRFPASPYGFGLTYDGLTASQKAILAAIGISHF